MQAGVQDEVAEALRMFQELEAGTAPGTFAAPQDVWKNHSPSLRTDLENWLTSAAWSADTIAAFPTLQRAQTLFQDRWQRLRTEFLKARRRHRKMRTADACPGPHCLANTFALEVQRWRHGVWKQYSVLRRAWGAMLCLDTLYPHFCALLKEMAQFGVALISAGVDEITGAPMLMQLHRHEAQTSLRMTCFIVASAGGSSAWRLSGFAGHSYDADTCIWFDEGYERELVHPGGRSASIVVEVIRPSSELGGEGHGPTRSRAVLTREAETCSHPTAYDKLYGEVDKPQLRLVGHGISIVRTKSVLRVAIAIPRGAHCQFSIMEKGSEVCVSTLRVSEGDIPEHVVCSFLQNHSLSVGHMWYLLDIVSTPLPYHAGVQKPWYASHGGGHSRTTTLLYLQERFGYGKGMYLEIGCAGGGHFARVAGRFAMNACIDPSGEGQTLRITSDNYFRTTPTAPIELALVDGLRTGEQALRDVEHILARLVQGGAIVMHDCNPNSRSQAAVSPHGLEFYPHYWTGDVFRAVAALRQREDIDVAVGDFDFGVGIVLPRPRTTAAPLPQLTPDDVWNMTYEDFATRRQELLQLMSWDALERWIR